jgi:phage regulator Rha-like protein
MTLDDKPVATPAPVDLAVVVKDGEPRVDSRQLAAPLGVTHATLFKLVKRYTADFESLGTVGFQIQPSTARGSGGDGQRFALLTEDQSYLLLAYAKNTAEARALKQRLVRTFRAARDRLEGRVTMDLTQYEQAMRVERDAAVSQALGGFGGKLMRQRRTEKPQFEQQLNALRLSLQLSLPWPKA